MPKQVEAKTEESLEKVISLAKSAFYTLMDYLKTGDSKYADRMNELLNTEVAGGKLSENKDFKEVFNKYLEGRLSGDPGLKKFIDAYKKEKGAVDPVDLATTTKGLFFADSMEKAIEEYGKELTAAFGTMVLWRLAYQAVNVFQNAFYYDKLASAGEEYARLEKKFLLFGKHVTDYDYFLKTFSEIFGEKVDKNKFNPLWHAYWEKFGDDISILGLLEAMNDCKLIVEDKSQGKKAAKEKYGEKFVDVLLGTLEMSLKPVPKIVEEPAKIKFTYK